MSSVLRLAIFIIAPLIYSQLAQAASYGFVYDGNTYSSGAAVCEAYKIKVQKTAPNSPMTVTTKMNSPTVVQCDVRYVSGGIAATNTWGRVGDSCAKSGYGWDGGVGACTPPSDTSCKSKPPYTKIVQFTPTAEGGIVLDLDGEVKDGCVFEPGDPQDCTSTQCIVPMTPVGNDTPADDADNPDPTKDLEKLLEELAKKFQCERTANGTVGCSPEQTTPPDNDPDDKCPPGYSWSGTTCIKTSPGTGGETGGGDDGGGTGGGDGGGDGGGTDPGTGGGDGGGDGGDDGGGGGGDDDGGGEPKEKLEEPKAGSWDEALKEWDDKLTDVKKEFKEKVQDNADNLKGVFDLNLGEGGGSLPCDTFTIWKKSVSLCFQPYEDKLIYLRYAMMFMASVMAAFIVLKE